MTQLQMLMIQQCTSATIAIVCVHRDEPPRVTVHVTVGQYFRKGLERSFLLEYTREPCVFPTLHAATMLRPSHDDGSRKRNCWWRVNYPSPTVQHPSLFKHTFLSYPSLASSKRQGEADQCHESVYTNKLCYAGE